MTLPEMDIVDDMPHIGTHEIQYVTEGSANVVFSLTVRHSFHPTRLLRLQKSTASAVHPLENTKFLSHKIKPLFDQKQVVTMGLWPANSKKIAAFNEIILKAERDGRRPIDRSGTYLRLDQGWVVFMEDMRPHGESQFTIDFKPKWLLQSPSAPASSIRCRTCALREMRRSDKRAMGQVEETPNPTKQFCPLDLLSNHSPTLRSVAKALGVDEDKLDMFARGLYRNATISRLYDAQAAHNNVGLEDFQCYEEVEVGMTLRDCSLFIRVDEASSPPKWECTLADLDIKVCDPQHYQKWAGIEQRLITEGWYEGTEADEMSNKKACNLKR